MKCNRIVSTTKRFPPLHHENMSWREWHGVGLQVSVHDNVGKQHPCEIRAQGPYDTVLKPPWHTARWCRYMQTTLDGRVNMNSVERGWGYAEVLNCPKSLALKPASSSPLLYLAKANESKHQQGVRAKVMLTTVQLRLLVLPELENKHYNQMMSVR